MGINPTPTNHRSFTFDGKSTREFGVYITGKGVFNAPERAVEMISIPGRDGEYALDQGHFNNIEVTYRAGIVADSTTDFAEAISNFRNWLASREGYCRLTDEYNTEEYRMAVFKNAIALEHEGLLTGEFDVTFDCKPQRFLAIGEELTEIGAWGNTETAEGEVVTIEASSDTAVKALTVDIEPLQDLHGYDAPWVGGAGKNKLDPTLVSVFPATTYGLTTTWNATKGCVTFSGTFTGSSSSTEFRCLNVPNAVRSLDVSGFSSSNNFFKFRWQAGEDVLVIGLQNMVNGSSYNFDVYPIIYSGTAPTAWTPYENICPISGHDEVVVVRTGKNLADFTDGYSVGANGLPSAYSKRSATTTPILIKPNKTYKGICSGTNVFLIYSVLDANNTLVRRKTAVTSGTVLDTSGGTYLYVCGYDSADTNTITAEANSLMVIDGNETDTTYEPYNGTTYTTTLPSTTYGGTLDVVSGLLTVTHGILDLGTLDWTYNNTSYAYAFFNSTTIPTRKVGSLGDAYCSQYIINQGGRYSLGNATGQIASFNETSANAVCVRDDRYADEVTFKQAMNGVQLVYPLATPQTYQLTPQQVELLLGENNIFADSGNVTVEYGHNPTLLTNPTWFPSKPLLEVDGYGEIKFNNRSIVNIENATLGDIKQLVNESKALSMTTTFDNARFNVGDTITVDLSYFNYGAYIIMNASTTPTTSGTVTDSDAHFTTVVTDCVADQGISPSPLYVHVKTTCTPITFTLGTPDTVTNTSEAVVDTQGDKCKWTQTVKYEIDGSGNHKITIKQVLVGATGTNVTASTNMNAYPMILCNSVTGHSTLSILGNPTYIDCDIGEAYMIKDDEPISLNQYIDLGSDLPTLPSGDTEVTYDNTITKVEVKPNWWKV
ncbi:MAG: hypothetical protein IIZ94_13465 [Prevotella sp.]|nr:hypothetical protein [Prevotella sp.]